MKENSLISIVTVNYNGYKDTCDFIESWTKHIKSVSYEIIVVDNNSINNESEVIKQRYPQVTTIRTEKNLGFAGANNLGIKIAKGDIIFFLNNDTLIFEDGLDDFLKSFSSIDNIVAVSPLILNNDKGHSIQYAGFTKLSSITLRNKSICSINKVCESDYFTHTAYLHGAAMLVKSKAIKEVGLLDEDYFLYYEELDWCEKFKKNGYKLYFSPNFRIIHKNSSSIGNDSPLKAYYITRNRLLFAYKNCPKNKLFFIILYHLLFAYPFHIIKAISYNRKEIAKAEIKGIIDFFKFIK